MSQSDELKRNLKIYTQVLHDVTHGVMSFTEANRYLDSIEFDPDFRVPGVHINDDGETEYYRWHDHEWQKI